MATITGGSNVTGQQMMNASQMKSPKDFTIQQLNQQVQELKDILERAKYEVSKRQDFIDKIAKAASEIGLVLQKKDDCYIVSVKGAIRQTSATLKDVKPGDFVLLSSETGQVVNKSIIDLGIGEVRSIRKIVDESHAEIETNGVVRVILTAGIKCEVGDRVVVDDNGQVVMKNLGRETENTLKESTGVSWDDVGGLISAKAQMREAIEMPFTKPDVFKRYGKKPLKGILLYGPPGCGKTMLGKAAATAVSNLHGEHSATGFIYVKGPEVLDKYVGESEAKIRRLFDLARAYKAKTGYAAVLFVDEAEALLATRGAGYAGWSNALAQTIVPTFLAEMDGLEDSGALVLLATNRPDILDPAVVREGRIDRKIEITRPNQLETADIFKIGFKEKPLEKSLEVNSVSEYAAEAVFKCSLASRVSGALVMGVVEQATSFAISRDLEGSNEGGISLDDVQAGIDRLEIQNRHVSAKEMYS